MSPSKGKTLAAHPHARHDYEILETYEAGISLTGAETKSAKSGHVQLQGAFVSFDLRGAVLKNAFIAPYKPAGTQSGYEPSHDRRLLLHKREIKRLLGKKSAAGLTVIPLRVYIAGRRVKVELGLARGRKKYEKRAVIKKREIERELRTRMYERQ